MKWILIQFELCGIRIVRSSNYLSCNICSLLDRVVETLFTTTFHFLLFCVSFSFSIPGIWWVRWVQQKIIWQTWIWIRVVWYVQYYIGWVVAWRRIAFICHAYWKLWQIIQWWCRVTLSINKYWCVTWSGYRTQMGITGQLPLFSNIWSFTPLFGELCIILLTPEFYKYCYTYTIKYVIYQGEPSCNFNFRLPWHIYICIYNIKPFFFGQCCHLICHSKFFLVNITSKTFSFFTG